MSAPVRAALVLSAALASALPACQSNSVLKELRAAKEAICSCPDKACIDALQASTQSLESRLKDLSPEDQEAAQKIAIEIMACQTERP